MRSVFVLVLCCAALLGCGDGTAASSGSPPALSDRALADSVAILTEALERSARESARALAVKDTVMRALSAAVELASEVDRVADEVVGRDQRYVERGIENWDQLLRRRLREVERRFRQLNAAAAATQRRLDSPDPENVASNASLNEAREHLARLASTNREQQRRIGRLMAQLDSLRAANQILVARDIARSDTIRTISAEAARIYWIAASKRELVSRGIVREEGGVLGAIGRSIVPGRALDPALFHAGDRRQLTEIPLPPGSRWLIVSRQDLSFLHPEDVRRGREIGDRLRIRDSSFWGNSPFLILVQR